jgi:thiol-disulfide isomerase/thioredoxin
MQVLCPVCVGMYLINFAILFLLIKSLGLSFSNIGSFFGSYLKSIFGRKSTREFSHQPTVYAILITWIFIVGYMGVQYFEKNLPEQEAVNIEEALKEHFEQTPISIKLDSSAAFKGNPESGITLIGFSDFECPACRVLTSQITSVLLEYRNDVSFYFMNYPLDKSINENL